MTRRRFGSPGRIDNVRFMRIDEGERVRIRPVDRRIPEGSGPFFWTVIMVLAWGVAIGALVVL